MFLTEVLLTIVFTLLSLLFSIWFYYYATAYVYLKDIPAPRTWPLFGNALALTKSEELLSYVSNLMQQLGSKTLRLHLGRHTYLITRDVAFFERILSNSSFIHKEYLSIIPWLGNGLFTSSGERWKKTRQLFSCALRSNMQTNCIKICNSNGRILINKLHKQINNPNLDIMQYSSLCSLDNICESAIGIQMSFQLNEMSDYVKSIHKLTDIVHDRSLRPWFAYDFIYKWSQLYKNQQQCINTLHIYTEELIKMRRKQIDEGYMNGTKGKDHSKDGFERETSLLDQLLQMTIDGRPLNETELKEEIIAFMFAGHDTIATAVTFTLYLLSTHPEIQERGYKEIYEIFGEDRERPCDVSDTNQMSYLEMIIKESLRMYPPAPFISRTLLENCAYDDIVIPKGTTVGFYLYGIHRDPDYFPNPETFNPERFSLANCESIPKHAFAAFSIGPRNCIGQKFAWIEMKVTLSLILRHFKVISVDSEHTLLLRSSMIINSLNGYNLKFVKRE